MEKLGTNAVFVIHEAKRLGAAEGDLNGLARDVVFFLNGEVLFHRIQIVPKNAFFQRGCKTREALYGKGKRHLQKHGLNIFFEVNREAENQLTSVLHGDGVNFCRIVKGEPNHRRARVKTAQVGERQARKNLLHWHALSVKQHNGGFKI